MASNNLKRRNWVASTGTSYAVVLVNRAISSSVESTVGEGIGLHECVMGAVLRCFQKTQGIGLQLFFLRQRDTKVTGGWFTGRTWKNNDKKRHN